MAGSGKLVERTLENVGVKAARLFIDVDQPVFVACDDADGHLNSHIGPGNRKRPESGERIGC
jgi:hypothetical protein